MKVNVILYKIHKLIVRIMQERSIYKLDSHQNGEWGRDNEVHGAKMRLSQCSRVGVCGCRELSRRRGDLATQSLREIESYKSTHQGDPTEDKAGGASTLQ